MYGHERWASDLPGEVRQGYGVRSRKTGGRGGAARGGAEVVPHLEALGNRLQKRPPYAYLVLIVVIVAATSGADGLPATPG